MGKKNIATIYRNIGHLLSLEGACKKSGRHIVEADLSIIKKATLVEQKGKILWIGPEKNLPKDLLNTNICKEVDLDGMTLLPGFVECHTHSLFAGTRAHEFEQRLKGVSYQEIAARGGGILSTVKATRSASEKALRLLTQERVDRFLAQGVTCLEIKTGYALDLKNELKSLKIINTLKGPEIVSTFLGAHAVAPEFSSAQKYLQEMIQWLPKVRKFTQRLDIWIEKNYFEASFAKEYLLKAKSLGFDIVIHADQLSLCGGSSLAVELGALSADHVIQIGDAEIQKISKSETTAVLLPAADLYMKCAYPPARKLIDAGARVALATDFNPGSCPTQDLSLVGLLARLEMKMTLPEVISAYCVGAAAALKKAPFMGSLEPKKNANFICIEEDWSHLFYQAGQSKIRKAVVGSSLNLF